MADAHPTFVPIPEKPHGLFMNLMGQRFGKLVICGYGGMKNTGTHSHMTYWWGQCDCGTFKMIRASDLRSGRTKSCGCGEEAWRSAFGIRNLTHGQTRVNTRRAGLYTIWAGMISRCHRPTQPAYSRYGGRGIIVCDEWRHSFEAFREYVGDRPSKKHSLDRINNDGNYEPGNVRWATDFEQAQNSRKNKVLTYNGETHCISEWARRLGMNPGTLWSRLYRNGLSVEDALTRPIR